MYRARSKNLLPNSVRIGLIDANIPQTWAQRTLPDGTIIGSVKKGDTINHTTSQPIANGLFCQRIFGPCIDYTCACGQTKINIHSNIHVSPEVCPDCFVEWIESSVRRHRLGYIQLISPVTHKWFADSGSAYIPSLIGTTVKTFKAIRDCRLFFPFSLQSLENEQPMHSLYCVAKAKSKSGDLLYRKRGKSPDLLSLCVTGALPSASFAPFAMLSEVLPEGNTSESIAKGAKEAEESNFLTIAAPYEAKGQQNKVAKVSKPMLNNVRGIHGILLESYESYRDGLRLCSFPFAKQEGGKRNKSKKNLEITTSKVVSQAKSKASLQRKKDLQSLHSTRSNFLFPINSTTCSYNNELLNTSFTFNGYHSLPVRPSFAQQEDYRRQFVRFFRNTGLARSLDVPIARYTQQYKSSHVWKDQKVNSTYYVNKATYLHSNKQQQLKLSSASFFALQPKGAKASTYNCVVRDSEFLVKSYFSEINSSAKEQTIKKILSQTGGGGLQKYLGLIKLGSLVTILKNDLDEIAPHLNRYKYAKTILRNAVKKNSDNLNKTRKLLEKFQNNYWVTVEHLTGPIPTGPELFEKIARLKANCKNGTKEYKAANKLYKALHKRKTVHKRRYKLAFQLWRTMSKPTGLTMSSVPVLPPGLRPIIDVPKVGPIASDLNVRYRKLVFALRNLRDLSYVDFRITGAAQTSVQEAVDDILYTGGKRKTVLKTQSGKNPSVYKSLAMGLKGKHGRFRGNLLGKRVDYSGRSVIVVGPTLKIHECGLPFELAIKLLNPFLIRRLIQKGFCKNVYSAKKTLGKGQFYPQLWDLCREEMLEHLVVLNRAPTLHRLGVQAFMPVLITGRAILLHPLVCTGFNADFDGDQMAVHIPLFPQAKAEAWKMMWSRNNFLAPSSGDPILLPSQDMVLGCYYLTESVLEGYTNKGLDLLRKSNRNFSNKNHKEKKPQILSAKAVLDSYTRGVYNLHSNVWVSPHEVIDINYREANKSLVFVAKELLSANHGIQQQLTRSNELLKPQIESLFGGFQSKTSVFELVAQQKKQALSSLFTKKSLLKDKKCLPIHFKRAKQETTTPNGLEGDGSSTPTLEVRVSAYGITRLFQTTGSKKRNFYSSILLLASQNNLKKKEKVNQGIQSSFEISSIRTTVGRLLFNELLQKFEIT